GAPRAAGRLRRAGRRGLRHPGAQRRRGERRAARLPRRGAARGPGARQPNPLAHPGDGPARPRADRAAADGLSPGDPLRRRPRSRRAAGRGHARARRKRLRSRRALTEPAGRDDAIRAPGCRVRHRAGHGPAGDRELPHQRRESTRRPPVQRDHQQQPRPAALQPAQPHQGIPGVPAAAARGPGHAACPGSGGRRPPRRGLDSPGQRHLPVRHQRAPQRQGGPFVKHKSRTDGPLPGPFRESFWRSPIRGPWLTSVFGLVLLIGIPVMFATGLFSYAAYNPNLAAVNDETPNKGLLGFYLFSWPTHPIWLYRLNQGTHVTLGLMLVPVVLFKLWSVLPKLFEWPPLHSLAHLLERISLVAVVGGIIFELATGILRSE